jgi:hypothetical protein
MVSTGKESEIQEKLWRCWIRVIKELQLTSGKSWVGRLPLITVSQYNNPGYHTSVPPTLANQSRKPSDDNNSASCQVIRAHAMTASASQSDDDTSKWSINWINCPRSTLCSSIGPAARADSSKQTASCLPDVVIRLERK